jgi:hypothetical protein
MWRGPAGFRPILIPWDATADHAIEHLIIGRSCSFVGPIVPESEDVVQGVRLDYARDTDGTYRASWVEQGTPRTGARQGRTLAAIQAGQSTSSVRALSTDLVWSSTTAGWVARWQSVVFGAARRPVVLDSTKSTARPGDVVLVTGGPWTARPMVVQSWRRTGDMRRLTLLPTRRI